MEKVSFVIPCYRSELTLEGVVREIREKMEELKDRYTYDVFLVNDCSPDGTEDVIRKLCEEDARIRGISLARNFGQHSALMAGLRYSDGDIVVCLDDDGQTPANQVDRLLNALGRDTDVVYAHYSHKQHSHFRNFGSRVNDYMIRVMLGKPKELAVSSYFAAKRFVVNDLIRYENSYPYVIGLVLRSTKHIANVEVDHREREVGHSGYTLGKLLNLWFNGFTAFSVKPLRIATGIGILATICSFIYGIYIVIRRLLNPAVVQGYAAQMTATIFFGGLILMMLGLIGEYVGRIYITLNNAPQYVIRESWNLPETSDKKAD
ncbi:MAG: glycosyltransferase family 2 protein [Lachnospiraceae bacterium]|nr:glycosyltransferase family 2 protein [Lachnospiraceae bacterium]